MKMMTSSNKRVMNLKAEKIAASTRQLVPQTVLEQRVIQNDV